MFPHKNLALALTFLSASQGPLHAADNPTSIQSLPIVKQMPDPLISLDGTKVTTPAQWPARREEIKKLLEDYEYGHMPPPPGNVTAHELTNKLLPDHKTNYRLLHLTFRPGPHGMNANDWSALLDFADLHLRKIPTTRPFHQLPTIP